MAKLKLRQNFRNVSNGYLKNGEFTDVAKKKNSILQTFWIFYTRCLTRKKLLRAVLLIRISHIEIEKKVHIVAIFVSG